MDDLKITKMLSSGQTSVLTTQQLAVLMGRNAGSTAVKLNRLVKRGVLVRITRGRFTLPSANILAVASSLYQPSYVSLFAAFEHYGTTTQSPRVIDVLNPIHSGRIKLKLEVGQFSIRFIKVDSSLVFGFIKEYLEGMMAMIAEKEKAVVDSLLLPGYVPLDETVACIRSKIDYKKAMEYAGQTGRQVVIKRLGYLLSIEGMDYSKINLPKLSKIFIPLDPAQPRRGKYDSKWRIIINRVVE